MAVDVEALIEEKAPIKAALLNGCLDAMRQHIQMGFPMVSWENGQVVEIQPEELIEILKRSGEEI